MMRIDVWLPEVLDNTGYISVLVGGEASIVCVSIDTIRGGESVGGVDDIEDTKTNTLVRYVCCYLILIAQQSYQSCTLTLLTQAG